MADSIGNLLVRIGADTSGLRRGLNESGKQVDSLSDRVRSGSASLVKYGAAAAAAGAAIIAGLVRSKMQAIDADAKLAQRMGETNEVIATLNRTMSLTGVTMAELRSGQRSLETNMAKAEQGVNAQATAFGKLGVSMDEIRKLPIDQQIARVNQALRENVDASERAAVAADIFGSRSYQALALIDTETIERARREAELFGTALSDVDAAKVEQANDALSTIGMAIDGILKQFTVQLAPVLKAVGDLFFETAEEAGGMGNRVESAFDGIVNAAVFVVNAADGIKRVFELTSDGIIIALSKVVQWFATEFAGIMEMLSKLPGVDLSGPVASLRGFSRTAQGVVDEAMANIDETLNRPLAGDAFRKMVDDAREAGQAAAEAAVAARQSVADSMPDVSGGMSPEEQAALDERLEKLRQSFATEEELLIQKYQAEQDLLREALEAQRLTQEEHDNLLRDAKERHEQQMTEIEEKAAAARERVAQQEAAAKQRILSNAFRGLTTLMNSESRKMFEIGKAASIAQALVATYTGAAEALKLGWPLGPPAAAAITANGLAQVASIRRQTIGGGGGGGAAASNTQQVNADATPVQQQSPQRNISFNLYGDSFSRSQVRSLLGDLGEEMGDNVGWSMNA